MIMKKYINSIKIYASLILIIFSVLIPSSAFAYDNNLFYSSNDILFYDDNDPNNGCIVRGTGSGNLVGNDNIEKAYRYLVGKGLTGEQASGVIGNLMQESSVNPTAVQNSKTPATTGYTPVDGVGFGIAQWTSGGRQQGLVDYANSDSANRDITDLSLQLDYLWYELEKNYPGALSSLQQQTDPVEAAIIFEDQYEASADSAEKVRNVRGGNATDVYNQYSGTIPDKEGTGGGGAGGIYCTGDGTASTFVDGFAIYNQNDKQWNDAPYGTTTIGAAGCGPSAMAMIVTALTGNTVTPVDTAQYGTYVQGQGSSWTTIGDIADQYGLTSDSLGSGSSVEVAQINEVLRSGGLVVTVGSGSAPYTSSGHFFVIRAVTDDGKWLVGDSNGQKGTENSSKEWDPASILGSANNLWAITK